MKEVDAVEQVLNEVDAATSSNVDVRTIGGDQDVSLPEMIIDWNTTRMPGENGHNSLGGYITDAQGNRVGIEHHTYWTIEFDITARFYSEEGRDEALNTVRSAFVPYEKNAKLFDRDTREWEIGASEPRNTPVIEPDWYESGILVSFEYVARADETGKDYIETITNDVGQP